MVGKVHPSVVILGLDVAAGLHENGGFTFEFHRGLVAVVARSLIISAVGMPEPELIAVVPLAALHRAREGATIVGEVGHNALAGASAREFFEEGIEAAAEIQHLTSHALRGNVVPFLIDAADVEPGGDYGVLEARTVFENDLFGTHVEEEARPLAGFPIVAVHEHVHTCAFSAETLGHGVAARAVDGHHPTALEVGERLVFIGIAVVPS